MSQAKSDLPSPWETEFEETHPARPLHEHAAAAVRHLAALWRARRMVLLGSLAGLVLASALSYTVRPTFRSTLTLMPPDTTPISGISMLISMKTGIYTGGLSSQFGDVLGMRSPGQLCMRQMGSRPVAEKLVRRFDLMKVYKAKTMEAALKALAAATKMEEDRKSGTISVTVTDRDPKRAAEMANAYGEEFGNLTADLNATAGRKEREYFEHELANARVQLTESTRKLAEFSATHGMVDANLQDAALASSAASLQAEIITTEAQIKSQMSVYGEENVRMKALRAKLAELLRQLEQMRGKVPLRGTVTGSAAAATEPGPSYVGRMAGLSVPYAELYRDVKVKEALVETLTQQYEIARLEESHRVASVQVLEPGAVPEKKFGPKRRQFALAGLLAGFLLSCLAAAARSWWRNTSDTDPWKRLVLHGPEDAAGGSAA